MKRLLPSVGRHPRRLVVALAALAVLLVSALPAAASNAQHVARVCGAAAAGYARCHALIRVDGVTPNASSPSGYNPSDLQSAYKLTSAAAGIGQTVAIVDAYDDPNAESDLGVYRSQFGLSACTLSLIHI